MQLSILCTGLVLQSEQRKGMRFKLLAEHELNVFWVSSAQLLQRPSLSFYLFSVTPNLNEAYALQRLLEDIHFEVEKLLSTERAWRSDKQVWYLIIFAHRRSGAWGAPVANCPSAEDWVMHPGFPGELFNLCRRMAGVCQVPACAAETPHVPIVQILEIFLL